MLIDFHELLIFQSHQTILQTNCDYIHKHILKDEIPEKHPIIICTFLFNSRITYTEACGYMISPKDQNTPVICI